MLVTKRKHAHKTKKSGFFGISRYWGISNIRGCLLYLLAWYFSVKYSLLVFTFRVCILSSQLYALLSILNYVI